MLPAAGAVPSGPHPVQIPEIRDQYLQVPAYTSCGTSSGTGMPPDSPSKRISCLDVSLPDGQDDFSDMSDSFATITYMDATGNSSHDSEKRSVITPPKRCRGSKRLHLPLNSAPAENVPKSNLTVIFKPHNPEHVITRFNPLRLKAAFEAVAPDGVLQVRLNERLNLLAVGEASERLLKAYEPRRNNCGVGVIKRVPVDLDQQDTLSALLQRALVKSVRRLGTSKNRGAVPSFAVAHNIVVDLCRLRGGTTEICKYGKKIELENAVGYQTDFLDSLVAEASKCAVQSAGHVIASFGTLVLTPGSGTVFR
ncbi:hypothetical protein HPB50_021579 [Hyalomma asiaticum]|uniref:Uncharacterized protein n=1 Tax=Hyalomma asiaticum TaxID=266040 RepID=A0ACB7SYM5_HYAAI|nr:hypothetical protein HPB50_021579 [Hyalomma asiaticum]